MRPEAETVADLLAGKNPGDHPVAGALLDGKDLPRRERVVPWDLAGVNLRGAVFTRLDLSGASFRGADLSGAAFRNVNLSEADFTGASAAGCLFHDVNLAYADFREADLRGASVSFANLADTGFKEADLAGASVNVVRFSMNGATHSLGLKEALRHRYGPVTYPFAAGVSGDAFCLTYQIETGELSWGGVPRDTLGRGLAACGLTARFEDDLDVETAWRSLVAGLKAGRGAITPVHMADPSLRGTGFGGSQWVYVSGYDGARNSVTVRCPFGDDMAVPWEDFVTRWCRRHPLDRRDAPVVYTFCVVGDRVAEVSPGEAVLAGIRRGIERLGLGDSEGDDTVSGIPAYDLLLRDLEVDLRPGGEGCAWLGLGLRHLHGSRWTVRDFLRDARRHLEGGEDLLRPAIEAWETVLGHLAEVVRLLPWALDTEEQVEEFALNREAAARHLRGARAGEERGRDRMLELPGLKA